MDISFIRRGIKLPCRPKIDKPQEVIPPREVKILLKQEVGPPLKPVVEVDDEVVLGQKVADGKALGLADAHASVSGTVTGIETLLMSDGSEQRAIVIESDGQDTRASLTPDPKPLNAGAQVLLERIRQAGVIKSGREAKSMFATISEAMAPRGYLSPTGEAIAKPVRHIAVRFGDPDPHLCTQAAEAAQLGDETGDLALGIQALVEITGAEQIHFALAKGQSLSGVEKLADERDYAVVRLDARYYPNFSDALVAATVLGREPDVAYKGVHENGILVVDYTTAVDIARAVRDLAPVVERSVTVAGPDGAQVIRARVGTCLSTAASATGKDKAYGKAILGGPMQGLAHHSLEFPLDKTIEGLTLIAEGAVTKAVNEPCMGCGLCAEVCPTRLVPGMLSRYCEFGEFEQAEAADLFTCIECGCCAYVCPAGRSMVQYFVHGKSERLAAGRSS